MSKSIDVVVANSSGNITIMVITPTSREDYKETARQLLEMKELGGEQVAFILPEKCDDSDGTPAIPKMEMCGLEFCGNASRAFALYTYRKSASSPTGSDSGTDDAVQNAEITVKVSGCDHPLTATINDDIVAMNMPIPSSAQLLTAHDLGVRKDGILVNIDGISHLILEDIAPSLEIFETIKDRIYENIDASMPAFGIMFYDTVNQLMTPVVYVKDVDSTYFEGSCASGTVAAAFALAQKLPDGTHHSTMQQPEGTLHTSITRKDGRIENIFLKGIVSLSDVIHVKL